MGFVYIGKGHNDSSFKIGTTSRQEEERLKQHRTANPSFSYHLLIESDAHRKIETFLHSSFESKRVRGTTEWFDLEPEDICLAERIAKKYQAEDLPMIMKLDQLKSLETGNQFIESIPSIEQDYLRLRELNEQIFRKEQEKSQIEGRLKLYIGLNAGIADCASWKSQTQQVFNSQIFKQENPDIYEKYRCPAVRRCFILI